MLQDGGCQKHSLRQDLLSPSFPPFLSTWLSQPDAGAQEPDATVEDDSYYTGGAYYYVQPADDVQE